MGHYSELKVGRTTIRLKYEIPAVWSFLFSSDDYFEVLGGECTEEENQEKIQENEDDVAGEEEDDDEWTEPEWFEQIGFSTTCKDAISNLDKAGYGFDFFTDICNLFSEEVCEALDFHLTEDFVQASEDEIEVDALKQEYFQRHTVTDNKEDLLDFAFWLKHLLHQIEKNTQVINLNLPSNNKISISQSVYQEWLGTEPTVHAIDDFFFQKRHLFPPSISRMSILLDEDFLFRFREIVTLVHTMLLLYAANEDEFVTLELRDITETRDEVMNIHDTLANEIAKKVHIYSRTFLPIAERIESIRNVAAKRKASSLLPLAIKEKNRHKKGELFEILISEIFSHPTLKVLEKRFNNQDEEIDLVLENSSADGFWQGLNSPLILVECKNWASESVGAKELRDFEGKIQNRRTLCKLGIFFALGDVSSECDQFLLRLSRVDHSIVLVRREKLVEFLHSGEELLAWLKKIISTAR